MLYESGKVGYYVTLNLIRLPGIRDIRYFRKKLFFTSTTVVNHFATKSYLRSETYISYKYYALYHHKGVLRREFSLYVETSCAC